MACSIDLQVLYLLRLMLAESGSPPVGFAPEQGSRAVRNAYNLANNAIVNYVVVDIETFVLVFNSISAALTHVSYCMTIRWELIIPL